MGGREGSGEEDGSDKGDVVLMLVPLTEKEAVRVILTDPGRGSSLSLFFRFLEEVCTAAFFASSSVDELDSESE